MIGNRSAYEQRLPLVAGKPYGEKIMRGGDDNTELARTHAHPRPPGSARLALTRVSSKACDSKSHAKR